MNIWEDMRRERKGDRTTFRSQEIQAERRWKRMPSLSDEHRKKMQEAQKKLNQGKHHGRKKFKHFKCEVLDYNGINYKIRFSQKDQVILTEDIPRKFFDDWNPRTKPLPEYWVGLFNRVEEIEITKGGEPD